MSSEIPVTEIRIEDTHRLIPSKFSALKYGETGTVLSRLTEDEATLDALVELDSATNDRLLGEEGLLPASAFMNWSSESVMPTRQRRLHPRAPMEAASTATSAEPGMPALNA